MAFPHIKPPLPERIEALTSGIAHTEARIAGLTPEQAKGPFGRALRAKLTSLKRSLSSTPNPQKSAKSFDPAKKPLRRPPRAFSGEFFLGRSLALPRFEPFTRARRLNR
jgi:hypothetical protein